MDTKRIIQTAVDNDVEKRFEDILIMYAAGIMSRMDRDYIKSVGWTHRAEQAAFQLGMELCQSEPTFRFGVSRLDKSYAHGRVKALQKYKLFTLDSEDINTEIKGVAPEQSISVEPNLPKSA